MKKYAVLKKIGCFAATVAREFTTLDDARMFRNLLTSSEDNGQIDYFIVEVLE